MGLIFLNNIGKNYSFLHEADAADAEAGGADMTGADATGTDATPSDAAGESAEDPAEGADQDNPDMGDDAGGDDAPDMGDMGGDDAGRGGDDMGSSDSSSPPDSSSEDPNAPQEHDPEETIIVRKKRQLFDYYAELHNSAKNLLDLLDNKNLQATYSKEINKVLTTLKKSADRVVEITEGILTKDFNVLPYENLLFTYQQHLSTIKLATKIFADLRKHES